MGGEPSHGPVGGHRSGPPPSSWVTGLAFGIIAVPFAVAVARLLAASGAHVYLPDDLALIDLHTRRALQWKQQLGVFDHNGWNHPGPTYFYLLALVYRVLGSGARAMFVGATLLNALAAVACLAVVRRRTSPVRTLWAALWLCLLAWLLAAAGTSSITYSEGALGGLVSPWNPMVVIFPLVLLVLLCGAAMDRSLLSLVAAVLVASFIVQTNISSLPPVAALVVVAAGTWVVSAVRDHRARGSAHHRRERREWLWVAAGGVALVVMWLPPLVQEVTNHPGNLTLIERFFAARHPGHGVGAAVWSVTAVYGVLLRGPSEVMRYYLGRTPHHPVAAVAASLVVVVLAVVVTAVGVRQRNRFAAGLGALTLVGTAATVLAVTRVVGPVFGYLVVWAVAIPFGALIGVGTLRVTIGAPAVLRRVTSPATLRPVLCVLGLVAGVLLVVRVAAIPPLSSASDPQVARLYRLVTPSLDRRGSVFVGDNGAGVGPTARLLDVERFVGLVNRLDQFGYRPTVNHFWKAQFGPGYQSTGAEDRSIQLSTWEPSSPSEEGYLGRVGDMAVTVTNGSDTTYAG